MQTREMSKMGTCSHSDRSFGPRVSTTCRPFDFTLYFEDIMFACLPATVFLLLSPLCIFGLFKRSEASSTLPKLLISKLLTIMLLAASQLAFLVLRTQNYALGTSASLAADVLTLVTTIIALVLSFLGHKKSRRPGTVLGLYLCASIIFGIARVRTLWFVAPGARGTVMSIVILILTGSALLLESIERTPNPQVTEKSSAPEVYSSFWTRTSFLWLASTFRSGYSMILSVKDLPPLDGKLESFSLQQQLLSSWDKYDHRSRHSLLRACFQSYFLSFISPVIPRLCLTAFTFSQPFLINTAINYVAQNDSDLHYGKGIIGACALVYLGIAFSSSIFTYQNFRFTTRLRGSLISTIYRGALLTRAADMRDITSVTLMSTDVERIVHGMQMFHTVWGSLLDIIIASWLLGRQVSVACLAPIVLVIVFIAATGKVSALSQTAQRKWIEMVQERLRLTEVMLSNIKSVKMLGITKVMFKVVQDLREREIGISKVFRKLLVTTLLLSLTPITLAPILTFALYAIISVFWKTETLLTAQAFTSLTLVGLLTTPVVVFIQGLPMVVQCIASFDRIQEFCSHAKRGHTPETEISITTPSTKSRERIIALSPMRVVEDCQRAQKPAISMQAASFRWHRDQIPALHDINVNIQQGSLTAIVGPVGSGKSAFLSSVMGEMSGPVTAGSTQSLSYCSQEAWLENTSIRQNIIGISSYNTSWYKTVTSACGLDTDFEQLPGRDSTRVGSKGINLSGGQKHRIAIARAVYSRKKLVLLDDVFSGMDAHTAHDVTSRLIGPHGLLRRQHTTVLLATHSNHIMSLADDIIVIQDGSITETGSPFTLTMNDGYVSKLGLSLPHTDFEAVSSPAIKASEFIHEDNESCDDSHEVIHTDVRRKNGEISVYKYYLVNAGCFAITLYVAAVVLWIFCTEFSVIWIKWWSEANNADPNRRIGMYMGIYAMFGLLGTLGVFFAAWFAFIPIISNTAANLHSGLLKVALGAPLSMYASTDNGELLNRFSQDIELIDMDLPATMVNYTSTAFSILVKTIILAVYSKYLGVTIPFLGIALYFLQRFYLQTSRQVRLLGIEARAPLYTQFSESVAGAVTIRAFGWERQYQERVYRHIDASQRPTYLQHCIQTWLAFVLDLVTAVIVVILIVVVITWHHQFSPGDVGVGLTMVVGFSETLTRLIQTWTKLESSIGAVARIKRFTTETESEDLSKTVDEVPHEWPASGAIELKGLTAAYTPQAQAALQDVSLSISSKQHVAICGRSGSGKTSLVLALLQMMECTGTVAVDGIDVRSLSPSLLRSRLNVIPQDPFLIPSTLRSNIDPSNTIANTEIIGALKRVGLWQVVEQKGGLDNSVDAAAWSSGQKQLLCLARAIVKKCNILVLDEAMSSVDSETESFMQEIISSEFRECTVIAVMHRLGHITRYDKVALLDEGKLLEYGNPEELLRGHTKFAELYKFYGT